MARTPAQVVAKARRGTAKGRTSEPARVSAVGGVKHAGAGRALAQQSTRVSRTRGRTPALDVQFAHGGTATGAVVPSGHPTRKDPFDEMVSAFVADARRSGLAARVAKLGDPTAFGAQLAALADARATWEAALGNYLSINEAAKVLGVSSRQAIHQRVNRGTLLAMDLGGQTVLPAYQFDGSNVRPEVPRVLRLLRPARLSSEALVSWFASPQPELEGARPAEWLGKDPVPLYEAARHTAGSLAHWE